MATFHLFFNSKLTINNAKQPYEYVYIQKNENVCLIYGPQKYRIFSLKKKKLTEDDLGILG